MALVLFYTHVIPPDVFGTYTIALAYAIFANIFVFQWLRVGYARIAQGIDTNAAALRKAFILGYGACALTLCAIVYPFARVYVFDGDDAVAIAATGLALALSWFDLTTEVIRARFEPRTYCAMMVVKALLSTLCGGIVGILGFGAAAMLLAAAAGSFFASAPGLRLVFAGFWDSRVRDGVAVGIFTYSLPLIPALAMTALAEVSDRFAISLLQGTVAAGLFAAANELPKRTIFFLMQGINVAVFPHVMRAFDTNGAKTADSQMHKGLELTVAVGLPACVGIVIASPLLAKVMFGPEYREAASIVLPFAAVATLINGFRAYYLDQIFQMLKKPQFIFYIAGLTLPCSWLGYFLLVPNYGLYGASTVLLLASVASLGMSWVVALRFYPVRLPWLQLARVVAAVTGMAGVMLLLPAPLDLHGLAMQMAAGMAGYGLCAAALNVLNCRALVRRRAAAWLRPTGIKGA